MKLVKNLPHITAYTPHICAYKLSIFPHISAYIPLGYMQYAVNNVQEIICRETKEH